MAVDHASLEPGRKISDRSYTLDAGVVAKYVRAVGDESGAYGGGDHGDLAPPMAVAALGLRGVVEDLVIPGGTLHTSQELEFMGAVKVGEELRCQATVLQNSVRGDRRFLIVGLSADDRAGRTVMTGKSTLVLPT